MSRRPLIGLGLAATLVLGGGCLVRISGGDDDVLRSRAVDPEYHPPDLTQATLEPAIGERAYDEVAILTTSRKRRARRDAFFVDAAAELGADAVIDVRPAGKIPSMFLFGAIPIRYRTLYAATAIRWIPEARAVDASTDAPRLVDREDGENPDEGSDDHEDDHDHEGEGEEGSHAR